LDASKVPFGYLLGKVLGKMREIARYKITGFIEGLWRGMLAFFVIGIVLVRRADCRHISFARCNFENSHMMPCPGMKIKVNF
jgi:hypothetical protein